MRILAGLAAVILLTAASIVTAIPSLPKPFESVRAIQEQHKTREGNVEFGNVCTATSINVEKHYWLTAEHCVPLDEKGYVEGHELTVVMRDPTNDVAIFVVPELTIPALPLSNKAPTFGDEVTVIGHPYGIVDPIIVFGKISNPAAELYKDEVAKFMMFDAMIAPGNSGSAVLNAKNQIISVVQIGWARAFSVGGGVPYKILTTYINYFGK